MGRKRGTNLRKDVTETLRTNTKEGKLVLARSLGTNNKEKPSRTSAPGWGMTSVERGEENPHLIRRGQWLEGERSEHQTEEKRRNRGGGKNEGNLRGRLDF